MRLSLLQRHFIILICILLLILCQQQKSDVGGNDVWRPHMDAVICTLIQHPDQPLATDLSKIKFSAFRWDNIFSLFPVNSKIIIAFSNTSFMSSRHCVCIPLRLWESPWLGQANTSHCQSMYNTIEKEFFHGCHDICQLLSCRFRWSCRRIGNRVRRLSDVRPQILQEGRFRQIATDVSLTCPFAPASKGLFSCRTRDVALLEFLESLEILGLLEIHLL